MKSIRIAFLAALLVALPASAQWIGAPWAGAAGSGNVTPPPPPDTITGNYPADGCGVSYVSGYTFDVAACEYVIQGTTYNSNADQVTLDAADPTDDRIDVIAVGTDEQVVVITGTPSATPEKPDVDPATQLELTFVYVAAASTNPDITQTAIYRENVEWTTAVSANINAASASNPHAGTLDVEITNANNNNNITFTNVSPLSGGSYDQMVLYIRPKAGWPAASYLNLRLRNGIVAVGNAVTIHNGDFGFNTNSLTYQLIVIPMSLFNVNAVNFNRLRIDVKTAVTFPGAYIDDIELQEGVAGSPVIPGMVFRGDWSAAAQYAAQDTVVSSGYTYVAAIDNLNSAPVADNSNINWRVIAPVDSTGANRLLGRGSAGGDGTWQEITLGAGLVMTGTSLAADAGAGGIGDVVGPASATDNAIARYDGATGKIIQNSGITIGDGATGALSGTNTGDQTITLTGDVTGTGTGSFAATIAANSVALGTDTTGNYVATVAGTANQVSVAGSGSETAAVTLSLPQDIAAASSPTFASLTLSSPLTAANGGTGVSTATANTFFSGPAAGGAVAPTFRSLVAADGTGIFQLYDADLEAIAALTTAAYGRGVLETASASALRTYAGLAIGTDVQAFDADLTALAALSGTNNIYYRSAANTWSSVTVDSSLSFSAGTLADKDEAIIVAASDETTAITTGTAKVTFRMPYAFTLVSVRVSMGTAPTGAAAAFDVKESGTTIFSTTPTIDVSEKTTTTAATPSVISDTALADDAEMTVNFVQVGSTIAGAGVKVTLIGHR